MAAFKSNDHEGVQWSREFFSLYLPIYASMPESNSRIFDDDCSRSTALYYDVLKSNISLLLLLYIFFFFVVSMFSWPYLI
jgi:hypothetical protein